MNRASTASRVILLLTAAGTLAALAACANTRGHGHSGMLAPGAAVPVSGPPHLAKVDLFGNGVGFFEYDGFVHNNARETLYFRPGQMADATKSLTLQDFGGGRVSEAVLHSRRPLAVRLARLPLDLNGSPSLTSILEQLTGEKITLTLRGRNQKTVSGRLINVHRTARYRAAPVTVTAGHPAADGGLVANLYRHGSVTTVSVAAIKKLHISNKKLRQAFHTAFHAITHRPSRRRRPLTLLFRGHGRRQVRFGYLQETPLWRMSYRLILQRAPESALPHGHAASSAKTTATLEALAIVHNQSNLSWKNIRLHLIGRIPASFIENLNQPLYESRPIVGLPEGADVSPQTFRHNAGWGYRVSNGAWRNGVPGIPGSFAGSVGGGLATGGAAQEQGLLFQTSRAASYHAMRRRIAPEMVNALHHYTMSQGIASAAAAGAVRPDFNYRIANVSIRRHRSAEVVVLATPVRVRRIDIYRTDSGVNHPALAVRLTNTSGKYLQAGPMTVFSNNNYAGDGQLTSLGLKRKQNIQFALDQQVTVKSLPQKQTSRRLSTTLKNGVLSVQNRLHQTFGYRVKNRSNRKKFLVIERPPLAPWKLVGPARFLKIKSKNGRLHWREALAPHHNEKMVLQRTNKQVTSADLTSDTRRQLLRVAKQRGLPPAIRRAIVHGAALRRAADIQKKRLKTLQAKRAILKSAQHRARKDLLAIKKLTKTNAALIKPLLAYQKKLTAMDENILLQRARVAFAKHTLARYWRKTKVTVRAHK